MFCSSAPRLISCTDASAWQDTAMQMLPFALFLECFCSSIPHCHPLLR